MRSRKTVETKTTNKQHSKVIETKTTTTEKDGSKWKVTQVKDSTKISW
jgi:hypothetical protein